MAETTDYYLIIRMKIFSKIIIVNMVIISNTFCLFGQESRIPIRFWGLQSIRGLVGMEAEYKEQSIQLRSTYSDNLHSTVLVGKLQLSSQSYFYHPNLMTLETEMEYNPGTRRDIYLVIPDRTDTNTGERVRGLLTFFRTQPLSLTGFANFNHLFTNRELTTNVETYSTVLGGGIIYRTKIAPISVTYQKEKTDQRELQTDRKYLTNRKNLRANTKISFTKNDNNKLTYTFDDYDREYYSTWRVKNKISSLNLNSIVNFDSARSYTLNSGIYYSVNRGNFNYDRLQINENLNLKLQSNFTYSGNYQYFNFYQKELQTSQQTIVSRLEHRLYKSLRTHIYYEYFNSNQTFSEELWNTGGIGINYKKRIPTGHLSLSYEIRRRSVDRNNLADKIRVVNEEINLSDDEFTLLLNPYVEINSIVITDETGTIIYKEGLDYLIIQRGEFIEIQRLLGGLITNNTKVFVSYLAESQPSYEYGLTTNVFSSRISIFYNLLEFYFRINENNYSNVVGADAKILKTFSQRVYGSKINYSFFTAGVEIDDYNSNIIPYESQRYYVTLNNRISNNFFTSITGNLKFIKLLDDNEDQKFHNVSGRLIYSITSKTSFNLEASYRFQKGRGLDLDLSIVRGELKTQFRATYLIIGIENYNRKYIGEQIDYLGGFIRFERKF